jgi:hypothetical protein
MKKTLLVALLLTISLCITAEELPADLYLTPIADSLPQHQWHYRQGLDFDVIHYETPQKNGVKLYMGVNENAALQSADFIEAIALEKPVKLFKKCSGKNNCMYSTTIIAGTQKNGDPLWVQLWITPENDNITAYINWLGSLQFKQAT